MASIARRIVSGQKARFKDPLLDLDLDLTYVTDHIIIMGFPASGVQSLYRNKRSDVRRFLDKRHEDLYRVYNFCPVTENSYDADEFYGRVSRFPFPDHHVPPLSLIPLFVADITEYLESDPDATAVIHCKAGKGRSGTMTCCYLVSLPYLPTAPTSLRNYSKMQRPPQQSVAPPPALAPIPSANGAPDQQQPSSTHALRPLDEQSPQAPPRSSSMTLQIPRSAAWTNAASSIDSSSVGYVMSSPASGTLRRRPSLAPEQSIIRNDDHNPESEIQQISQRLQTIFDLHTERRMKPQSQGKATGRQRARSNAAGLRPSAHSTGAMPSAATSTLSLRALGAGPAGRSCDALHMSAQSTNDLSLSMHSRYATHSRASTSTSYYQPADSSLSTSIVDAYSNSPYRASHRGEEDEESIAVHQNTEDHSDTKKPKMGVSVPSQRRWVGYWTRILSGRDARLSMTSTIRQPRRQIRITRISVERRSSPSTGKAAQSLFEKLVPHSDSLSVQLVRYDDSLVDRLESWERHARRRAKAFGQHNPSGLAGDLDAEQQQQQQYLKSLRRKASDLHCWDGNKFGSEHEGKIGNWGIQVAAEAERARAFDWRDDQPQLKYFSLMGETSGIFTRAPSSSPSNEITPPSSTSYLPHHTAASPTTQTTSTPLSIGQVLDADREVCIKVLIGRTGSKHSKLPDIASAGWCWFIPSFEDPDAGVAGMARVGARTQIRFEKDEIDFRKQPLGLLAIEVKWEWISVGVDEQNGDGVGGDSDDGHY
ncbi:hypothetical protein NDA16_000093 [Ustilago loliicola]|nr:hypothetical protein NDA16_000093 [Ustilago loliicola]